MTNGTDYISQISWRHILTYFKGHKSLFRTYQDLFLERYGPEFQENVIEIGGEKHRNHQRFFSNAIAFSCSNIAHDFDQYLDVTDMKEIEDESQDGYVCVSVLEHVLNTQRALEEIHRTLKLNGKLLLIVPFAYPHHNDVDYWRFGREVYLEVLKDYDIVAFTHLGGMFSTAADTLQRPRGSLRFRYLVYKTIGVFLLLAGKILETQDNFPLGYAIYAVKKGATSQ